MLDLQPKVESEIQQCVVCGSGLCPGPEATPYIRRLCIKGVIIEWAGKDIPQEEYEKWVDEFIEAQIDCAVKSAATMTEREKVCNQ